jgi:hypothetical protein
MGRRLDAGSLHDDEARLLPMLDNEPWLCRKVRPVLRVGELLRGRTTLDLPRPAAVPGDE